MIENISQKSVIANKQAAEATEKKAFLEIQSKEIEIKKAEADKELEEA